MPENAVSALFILEGVNIRNFPRRRRIPVPNFVRGVENYTPIKVVCKVPTGKKRPKLAISS
jgi:hypothetical protein